jgi:hypothetical protein
MAAKNLHVAIGADQEEPGIRDLARQELEEKQGRLVGPVDVVEDDDERRFGGAATRFRAGALPSL